MMRKYHFFFELQQLVSRNEKLLLVIASAENRFYCKSSTKRTSNNCQSSSSPSIYVTIFIVSMFKMDKIFSSATFTYIVFPNDFNSRNISLQDNIRIEMSESKLILSHSMSLKNKLKHRLFFLN